MEIAKSDFRARGSAEPLLQRSTEMRGRLAFVLPFACAVAAATATPLLARDGAAPVDPRKDGLEIAMGEWTLVAEAKAIRPGEVTFVVSNRGKFAHGFRVRDGAEDGDRTGKDRFRVRTRMIQPGETVKLTVSLPPGTYRIDCYVEDTHGDHADLGMIGTLEVRADAPFVNPTPKPSPAKNVVRIAAFKYAPTPVTVKRGTTVKWVNEDAAKHTVSALNGAFTSKELTKGQTYSRKFPKAGTFAYLCAVHPSMKAKLIVKG